MASEHINSTSEGILHYAHSTANGSDWQLLRDHLLQTALRAKILGSKFGAAKAAALAGSLHDLGKYSEAYQNGVVADTAFHDLPAPEPQQFDFGSLERSTRKNGVGRFNLGKVAHRGLSQSLKVDSNRKPSFLSRSLIRSAPHSH